MSRFSIENFGCRATQADTAAIERQLLEHGFQFTASHATSDVVVLNTCTVTASADTQARQAIRKIHRTNPAARIVVTGCYAQRAPEELAGLEGVIWVVGNAHQAEIPGLLERAFPVHSGLLGFVPLAELEAEPLSLSRGPAKILTGDIFEQTTVQIASLAGGEGERTRPILKIQDGCNNRCAYCVIPFVRGRGRSMPLPVVVEQVRRLARAGYKEIVLSGINLGSYGRDLVPRCNLESVLRRILEETPLDRLRLSSVEPMDVTADLVGLIAATSRLAPHFHVPLQSGSDRILKAMHRWYRTEHYARRIELIRERLPDAAIGADVLTGFPGETEDDHLATLDFLRALPFTYLHVFSFSKRPGTTAAEMEGEAAPVVLKRRAQELRALSAEKSAAFRASQAGRTLRVLTLHRSGQGWTEALSENYLRIRVAGRWPANEWLDVCSPRDPSQPVVATPLAPVQP
jgi:threonylcarbamoyladenosine tRNA methylthiotransferase MtaB